MKINTARTHIDGVIVVKPEVFRDDRGFFLEVFRADQYRELGLPSGFVQFNHSGSVRNVVRGLHFQWEPPMGKLMRVVRGAAFLVAVDVRKGSPTLGEWYGRVCSEEDQALVCAPAGCARGFCVVSDYAEIQYLCTGTYNNKAESGVRWNDPRIGIEWPVRDPILSPKDRDAQTLDQWLAREESALLPYGGE
ncbi:MAG: dTDP-4-dehydrorhamnose 3,5-epimerase [Deltaproteobacteria bacterium]|nr:dTDP-4-dehydrorhamnose 3,5-epimerase [Deltaproteobacteria bacterium]